MAPGRRVEQEAGRAARRSSGGGAERAHQRQFLYVFSSFYQGERGQRGASPYAAAKASAGILKGALALAAVGVWGCVALPRKGCSRCSPAGGEAREAAPFAATAAEEAGSAIDFSRGEGAAASPACFSGTRPTRPSPVERWPCAAQGAPGGRCSTRSSKRRSALAFDREVLAFRPCAAPPRTRPPPPPPTGVGGGAGGGCLAGVCSQWFFRRERGRAYIFMQHKKLLFGSTRVHLRALASSPCPPRGRLPHKAASDTEGGRTTIDRTIDRTRSLARLFR